MGSSPSCVRAASVWSNEARPHGMLSHWHVIIFDAHCTCFRALGSGYQRCAWVTLGSRIACRTTSSRLFMRTTISSSNITQSRIMGSIHWSLARTRVTRWCEVSKSAACSRRRISRTPILLSRSSTIVHCDGLWRLCTRDATSPTRRLISSK